MLRWYLNLGLGRRTRHSLRLPHMAFARHTHTHAVRTDTVYSFNIRKTFCSCSFFICSCCYSWICNRRVASYFAVLALSPPPRPFLTRCCICPMSCLVAQFGTVCSAGLQAALACTTSANWESKLKRHQSVATQARASTDCTVSATAVLRICTQDQVVSSRIRH